jgi:hypothetical protein
MNSKISHSTIFGAPSASASSTFAAGAPLYAFGHSKRELKRLTTQSRLFDEFTRRMFEQAGLAKGMRVLDVRSGNGDVAFLAASFVGESEAHGDRARALCGVSG